MAERKPNPYDAIKVISQQNEPVIVSFSCGRDSIVMLDLMMKHYKGDMKFVYYYFVPNLSYKEKILQYYEKKYGIEILRRPSWDTLTYMLGHKVEQGDVLKQTRRELDRTYMVMGYRRSESLTRRGFLAHIYDIDEKFKYYYPIIDWSQKQVEAYVRMNKLPIGEEYSMGLKHDISVPDAKMLYFIKNQYPDDYLKIINTFPNLEAGIKRIEMFNNGKK